MPRVFGFVKLYLLYDVSGYQYENKIFGRKVQFSAVSSFTENWKGRLVGTLFYSEQAPWCLALEYALLLWGCLVTCQRGRTKTIYPGVNGKLWRHFFQSLMLIGQDDLLGL
jgi:hypothetical protein